MNKKQRTTIIIGIVLIVLTGLCAPWSVVDVYTGMLNGHCYAPIFACEGAWSRSTAKLDTAQLYAEWVFIALVIGGFMLLNTDRRE
ncbi:MAG: hypothetical protein NT018_06055 [Armatimonadetes bacterium]|nr:hypothetical protein [Armatimonadota bacterium]